MTDLSAYTEHLQHQDVSPHTLRTYLSAVRNFARWYKHSNGEGLTPEKLTPSDIREYRQYLVTVKRAKPNTVNQHLAALRNYAAWAKAAGHIQSDPTNGVRWANSQKLAPRWLDKREEHAILREAERALNAAQTDHAKFLALRDHAILVMLLNTGLRVSELCALDLSDLELSERKGSVVVRSGKGGKRRVLPLNANAREALRAWLKERAALSLSKGDALSLSKGGEEAGALFLDRNGKRLTPAGLHRRLVQLGERVNVELHAHTLRHTFAKRLVDSGVTLEKVASLLGHSNLNTTRIYITPGERDLERAVEVLE